MVYLIVLICVMIEVNQFQSIVLNFDVVLSLVMYIQGLRHSLLCKAKRWPNLQQFLLW